MGILNQVIGQLVALFTFFGFPASQYVLLKVLSRKDGRPELWYLPDHGFRLVLRNLPRKRVLTDIKYRVFIRQVVRASGGSSVASIVEKPLRAREEMVLFPGIDQILLGFKLYQDADGISKGEVILTLRGSTDQEPSIIKLGASDILTCDYSATIQNLFNFDVQVGKRIEISGMSLFAMLVEIQSENIEQRFSLDRVRSFQ